MRVFSRLLAYDGQTTSSAGQKLLWAAAEAVLPSRDVGRFNQALMELGSEVCRGRARPAMSARPRGCALPNYAGCKTRSPVPSRGRNSKRLPRRPCSSAAAVACS